MKLRIVSTSHIAEDSATMSQDSSNLLLRSKRFNTTHHSHDEIVKVVPEAPYFTHVLPPWTPYSYTIWRELVAKSQGLNNHHIFNVPSFICDDLMLLHSSWLRSSDISTAKVESVIENWSSSKSGKILAALLDGTQRWFIRLDQMSPKDSPLGGDLPSSTFVDIITKICSSMRAFGCMQSAKEDSERGGDESGPRLQLILNLWNDEMDPAKEFRVFVPPPAARGIAEPHIDDLEISGISQYRWHQTLQITPVQLIEMNPFGAMSGCGACLFNWVLDARMLYALDEGEIAVTLEVSE